MSLHKVLWQMESDTGAVNGGLLRRGHSAFKTLSQLSRLYKPFRTSPSGASGVNGLLGHVLQLDVDASGELLAEFSAMKESQGSVAVSHNSIDLFTVGAVRDYYLSKRSVALELVLQMCRVARDSSLSWSACATDGLSDLFSTVESPAEIGSTDIVEALVQNITDMVNWEFSNPVKSEFCALSPVPSAEDLYIFCGQHGVAHGTAVVRELGLVLDVLTQVLRCGCSLTGDQLFRLLELGTSVEFGGPALALQLVADQEIIGAAASQLTFKWTTLLSCALDCRVALSSPGDHVLFKALSRGESVRLQGDEFLARVVAPLMRLCGQAGSDGEESERVGCAGYVVQLISMLLQTTADRIEMLETNDTLLNEYAEWASEAYEIVQSGANRSESISFLADFCFSHIRRPDSVSTLFEMDCSNAPRCWGVYPEADRGAEYEVIQSSETFDSVDRMATALQCSVFQEVLDFFLLDLFRDVDNGGALEVDVPLLSLVSQLYCNDPHLCRPFWEQWSVYRASTPSDIKLVNYEPFSPLCRLILELSRTLEAPSYFIRVVSSLLCDEKSCRECFGFLEEPVVLRSWERIENLEPSDQAAGGTPKGSIAVFRNRYSSPQSLRDIIGRPFEGAFGKVIAVASDSEMRHHKSSWRLVRWEDNCYSSWWGVCFNVLASSEASDYFLESSDFYEAKASVRKMIANILYFEGQKSLFEHFESHWNDLCALHTLNHIGAAADAGNVLSLLRHSGITPAALKRESMPDAQAADIVSQCSGLTLDCARSLVVLLRGQFISLSELIVTWCFDESVDADSSLHLPSSLSLMHSLMRCHDGHLFLSNIVLQSVSFASGGSLSTSSINERVLSDLIASVCEKNESSETFNLRYQAIRAFDALVPLLLAPDSVRLFDSFFRKLDRSGRGKLSESDFREVLPDVIATTEYPAVVMSKIFFRDRPVLDFNNFFEACASLKNEHSVARLLPSFTAADKIFAEYIGCCFQEELKARVPESFVIANLTSISKFCVRTLLVCECHKKRNADGIFILDKSRSSLSQLQIRCLKVLLRIASSNACTSGKAAVLREWLGNCFVSDSSFQGAILRAGLELGINSVLLRELVKQDFSSITSYKAPKLSSFKSIKDLVYGSDALSPSSASDSSERKKKDDSLLPLNFSYLLPHQTCLSSLPRIGCGDTLLMESLSELALQLLASLIDILSGDPSAGLPALLSAFNSSRAYHAVAGGNARTGTSLFGSDGRIHFMSSLIGYKDTNSYLNVSYSGILCGLLDYDSAIRKRSRFLVGGSDVDTSSKQLRISGLASVLLTKLLHGEHLMRTIHSGVSYSNRIFDCIGAANVASLTRRISSVLEIPHSKSATAGEEKIAELLALKIEVMNLLLYLAKNDQMSLGHLLLVTGEIAAESAMPPRPGQTGSSSKSVQSRSLISSAVIALLTHLDSTASFRKACSLSELVLLNCTTSYLLSCWETCRSGASAVLAAHVVSVAESNIFWSVVTSPLMRDLEPLPELSQNSEDVDVGTFVQRPDVACYCHRLFILASSLSFLSMERFGQIYSIEDTTVRLKNLISSRECGEEGGACSAESSGHQVGNFCRGKVDDFFRRCAESQRFLYWTRTYPNIFVEMKNEQQAQAAGLYLGMPIQSFRRSVSNQTFRCLHNVGSDYVYSMSAVLDTAVAAGWNPDAATEQRHIQWTDFIIRVSNVNCMWSVADSQNKLLKNLRHFLEITVFPPESADNASLSRSLSISSRRSPSFELNNSPRVDGTGSPVSTHSNSPKLGRNRVTNSMLSPKGGSHFVLPPSPSAIRGESSFIGDKRSYHLLVELLRQVAYGDNSPHSATASEKPNQPETYFSMYNKASAAVSPDLSKVDELGILVFTEKIAIVTTMLHHQLKDICVRTVDPSLAKTKFRDVSSSRLTMPKIVELLELVCTAYKRILESLSTVLNVETSRSKRTAVSFWRMVWSNVSVDLLTCMQLLILALQRSSAEVDQDSSAQVADRVNAAKQTAFEFVIGTLMTDSIAEPHNKHLLVDSSAADQGRRRGTGPSSAAPAVMGAVGGDWVRPSDLVAGESALENGALQDTFDQNRVLFVKISMQVLCSALPTKVGSERANQWSMNIERSPVYIEFVISLMKELMTLSSSNVERECDYSRWEDYSDCQRSWKQAEFRDSSIRASSSTRKFYEAESNNMSYWGSLNSVLDILIKLVDASVLRPGDSSMWTVMSLLNSSLLFRKFQHFLMGQKPTQHVSLLMAYSASTGDDSALCAAWGRCVRFVTAVAVCHRSELTADEVVSSRTAPRPLSLSQLLCIFVDTYKEILLLPFVDASHRVSIGQIHLLKTSMSLFNAYDHSLAVWRCISNLHLLVRQRASSAVCFISSTLGDGSRISTTTEHINRNFVFLSDMDHVEVEKGETAPDSRPASPHDDEKAGRSQSFDSFSEAFTTPRTKKTELSISAKKTSLSIGILLEVLVPLLSYLRHSLPSPFIGDTENRTEKRSCFDGGSMLVPPQVVTGTSVVYRTKREKAVPNAADNAAQDPLGRRLNAGYSVIEDELEVGVVIDVNKITDMFVDDSKNTYDGYDRQLTVYTMLLLDGTIEDGVPSESVVSASAPLIPYLTRHEIQHQNGRKCTSAHLVQLLQFLTSTRFIRLCKSCEDDLFQEEGAIALRSVLDSNMGNVLTCLASVMAHISCTLDTNSDGVPVDETENVLIAREGFCEQLQDILALIFRHKSVGAVDDDYYLLNDEWVEFLKPYEGFIRSLLRRHMSYDTDVSFLVDDDRASPDDMSMMRTRDGTLRTGPVFLELC